MADSGRDQTGREEANERQGQQDGSPRPGWFWLPILFSTYVIRRIFEFSVHHEEISVSCVAERMRRPTCDLRLLDCIAEDEIVLPVCGMPLFAHEHGDLRPMASAMHDNVGEKFAPAPGDRLSAASGNGVLLR